MYCRNCGKEITPNSEYCMSCGARPLTGTVFCPACGGTTTPLSEICVKCGSRLITPVAAGAAAYPRNVKSKVASILLAVFLSCWTWLYTYKKDGWKFWTGMGISLAIGIIGTVIVWVNFANNLNTYGDLPDSFLVQFLIFYVVALIVGIGLWIWAIVDTAIKSNEWYDNYPNLK